MLPAFAYHRPGTLTEALEVLETFGERGKILAGGTDLLLQMERDYARPEHLVSLKRIQNLSDMGLEDGLFHLGANTTHRAVELSPVVRERFGALHDAVSVLGSIQIRNVATVAGNICNGAPSADTSGPLLALGASAKVMSLRGERVIALEDFFLSPGRTALNPGEMLVCTLIPEPLSRTGSAYTKMMRRKAMDLAMLGVSVSISLAEDRKRVQDARIALTTLAPTPLRSYKAEGVLKGERISEALILEAAEQAVLESCPRSSYRSTAEYRKEMIRVLLPRTLSRALGRLSKP